MADLPKIILKPGKEQSLNRFHPWVFSGAIGSTEGTVTEGDLVEVFDSNGGFQALGHCQIGSIAVRVLSFQQREANYEFWKEKLQNAYNLRVSIGLATSEQTNAYRLVHAEGDGLPGLIIDYYNGTAVVQMHTVGMYLIQDDILQALKEIYGHQLKAVYNKSEGTLPYKADMEPENGYVFGRDKEKIAMENGLKFHVDWEKGQKTGFFVDQRDNRALLEQYSKDIV